MIYNEAMRKAEGLLELANWKLRKERFAYLEVRKHQRKFEQEDGSVMAKEHEKYFE